MNPAAWPLFGLRLHCRDIHLRPVREADLGHLAAIQPDDYEHDPRSEMYPWLTLAQNRARLTHREYWRTLGTWSPSAWALQLAVEFAGEIVGMQVLEAERFPTLRTVNSAAWLVPAVRGRGIGVAMRMAVLGLAFDHLDAVAAVSSARSDNGASLGVSRSIGYTDNGVSLNASGQGVVELRHVRLTAAAWRASGRGAEVTVEGLAPPCLPWFGR